eukprot:scaffold216953_cov21-Tisochrysis_lutea.AAC.1
MARIQGMARVNLCARCTGYPELLPQDCHSLTMAHSSHEVWFPQCVRSHVQARGTVAYSRQGPKPRPPPLTAPSL